MLVTELHKYINIYCQTITKIKLKKTRHQKKLIVITHFTIFSSLIFLQRKKSGKASHFFKQILEESFFGDSLLLAFADANALNCTSSPHYLALNKGRHQGYDIKEKSNFLGRKSSNSSRHTW